MTAQAWLVQLPTELPGQLRFEGANSLVIWAETADDAMAMAEGYFPGGSLALWDNAVVTPLAAGAGGMSGWTLRVVLSPAVAGVDLSNKALPSYGHGYLTCDVSVLGVDTVQATDTLTFASTTDLLDSTVTVGDITYKFVSSLTGAANEVKFTTADSASTHLAAAINNSGGAGTTYGLGTVTNPAASAVDDASGDCAITAIDQEAVPGGGKDGGGYSGNYVVCSFTDTTDITDTNSNSGFLAGGVGATIDSLAALMVTALNAVPGVSSPYTTSPPISHASYDSSTNVLTIAGAADGLGDNAAAVFFYPPNSNPDGEGPGAMAVAIPGFVTAILDSRVSGDAVTATFAADAYGAAGSVPLVLLVGSTDQPGW